MGLGPLSDDRTPEERAEDELRDELLRVVMKSRKLGVRSFHIKQQRKLDCYGRVAVPHVDAVITITDPEDDDGW